MSDEDMIPFNGYFAVNARNVQIVENDVGGFFALADGYGALIGEGERSSSIGAVNDDELLEQAALRNGYRALDRLGWRLGWLLYFLDQNLVGEFGEHAGFGVRDSPGGRRCAPFQVEVRAADVEGLARIEFSERREAAGHLAGRGLGIADCDEIPVYLDLAVDARDVEVTEYSLGVLGIAANGHDPRIDRKEEMSLVVAVDDQKSLDHTRPPRQDSGA